MFAASNEACLEKTKKEKMVDEPLETRWGVVAMHLVARACLAVTVVAFGIHLDIAPKQLACGAIAVLHLMQSMLNLAGAVHLAYFVLAESVFLTAQMISTDMVPAKVVASYCFALVLTGVVLQDGTRAVCLMVNVLYILFQVFNAALLASEPELRVAARAASICAFACIVSHRAKNHILVPPTCLRTTLWALSECVPFAMLATSSILVDSDLDVATACVVAVFSIPIFFAM